MQPPPLDLSPRTRLVPVSAEEADRVLRGLNLGDDPFDPRQGLALGSHAFLTWLAQEWETWRSEQPGAEPRRSPRPRVLADWPEDLQRPGWVLELEYHGHRLALFVVCRREDAEAPAPYALPVAWVASRRASAVCFAYVQVSGEADPDAAMVLLDGWVDANELSALELRASAGSRFLPVDRAALKPMHGLFALLREPAGPARPLTRDPHSILPIRPGIPGPPEESPLPFQADLPPPGPAKRKPPGFWLLGMTAASTLIAVILGLVLALRPPEVVEVVKTRPPDFKRPVVQMDFQPGSVRGSSNAPVVHNGQEYTFAVRAATRQPFGWLFLIDRASVSLLTRLSRQEDGTLAGQRRGRFDQRPGWEYFVTVLGNREPEALGGKPARVGWLTPEELGQLQELAQNQDDQAALAVIRQALERAGLKDVDVRLQRVEHRP
jgi:hypothetical protein